MLTDLLTFYDVPTSGIRAGNDLLPTLAIMDLHDESIGALLSTVLTLVISVGTNSFQVFFQILLQEARYPPCIVLGRELK